MSFTITHKTTIRDINAATKTELVAAIGAADKKYLGQVRVTQPKAELVEWAEAVRVDKFNEHALEEAAELQRHEAQVAKDLEHPRFMRMLEVLTAAFGDLATFSKAQADKGLARIAKDPLHGLEWETQSITFHSWMERLATEDANHFSGIVVSHSHTIADLKEMVAEEIKERMSRVLSYSLSHSTNPIANVLDECRFRAMQQMAKVWNRLPELIEHDLNASADDHYWVERLTFCY